ncbi:MAG: protein kinase, partial [Chloroflexi bacterium]|nr:protein kinase [Chloroflexota bacterium]
MASTHPRARASQAREADPLPVIPELPGLEISELVASRGAARVYLATIDQRQLIVKLLDCSSPAQARERLLLARRRASVLVRASHPALNRTHAVGVSGSMMYVLRDYLPGRPLDTVLAQGALPESAVVELAQALCGGLGSLHALSNVHRDLKPSNIVLGEDGATRII